MAQPMEPTVVRASSLTFYGDCARRSAARMFRREIEAAGFKLRRLPQGIGAAAGTAVHSASALMLDEKARTGSLPPADTVTDCAVQSVKESIAGGVAFDARVTPNAGDAHVQVARMSLAYRNHVAPTINPIIVEERLEAQFSEGIVLSGQADVVAREPGRIRDTKTGTRLGNHAAQLGAYSLLARTPTAERPDGIDVHEASVDFIQRVSVKKNQPDPVVQIRDIGAAETAATNILRHIENDLATFRHGDERRRILPGDPWSFVANPNSILCGEKYCEAFNTEFCREHAPKAEDQ